MPEFFQACMGVKIPSKSQNLCTKDQQNVRQSVCVKGIEVVAIMLMEAAGYILAVLVAYTLAFAFLEHDIFWAGIAGIIVWILWSVVVQLLKFM